MNNFIWNACYDGNNLSKIAKSRIYQIQELRLESLQNAPRNFGSSFEEERSIAQLMFENRIQEGSPDQYVFGAFLSDMLVGICGFIRETQIKTRHKGTIVQLYVKPSHQGNGIGKELLKAIIREAFSDSEVEQLMLGVVADNQSAIKIYEDLGFTRFGLQQRCFKVGDSYSDELLMILYLENYVYI